jgi:soluble lytic murein transglycosylase-like protein
MAKESFKDRSQDHEIEGIIRKAADRYSVDFDLIKRVIQAESDFNPDAVSAKGAAGLMQLMPETAKELGVKDSFDPTENIMGGTRYLRKLLDRYEGSVPLALAAYNWGMGNLDSHRSRIPAETVNYVAKISGVTLV